DPVLILVRSVVVDDKGPACAAVSGAEELLPAGKNDVVVERIDGDDVTPVVVAVTADLAGRGPRAATRQTDVAAPLSIDKDLLIESDRDGSGRVRASTSEGDADCCPGW